MGTSDGNEQKLLFFSCLAEPERLQLHLDDFRSSVRRHSHRGFLFSEVSTTHTCNEQGL